MAHARETRTQVRRAYVQGEPLKTAAALFGVSYQTARVWRDDAKLLGDDWEMAKRARQHQAGGDLSTNMARAVEEVMTLAQVARERFLNKEHAQLDPMVQIDGIARLSATLEKMAKLAGLIQPPVSKLAVLSDGLQALVAHVSDDAQALDALQRHLEPFAQKMASKWGAQ